MRLCLNADAYAAVTDSLETTGTLEQLRAKVRAGIFNALEGPQVPEAFREQVF